MINKLWQWASIISGIVAIFVFLGVRVPWPSRAEMESIKLQHAQLVTSVETMQKDIREIRDFLLGKGEKP